MKKSSSVYLSESTWEEIQNYMNNNSCSRNEAIERMLNERKMLITLSGMSTAPKVNGKIECKTAENNKKDDITKAAQDAFLNMK